MVVHFQFWTLHCPFTEFAYEGSEGFAGRFWMYDCLNRRFTAMTGNPKPQQVAQNSTR